MTMPTIVVGAASEEKWAVTTSLLQKIAPRLAPSDFLESTGSTIGINDVRFWRQWLAFAPQGDRRVLLIRQADNLTAEAQNAFLKTLEEPPPKAAIILEAESEFSFLPTVLSRCRVIQVSAGHQSVAPSDEAVDLLAKLDQNQTGETFSQLATLTTRDLAQKLIAEIIHLCRARLPDRKATSHLRLLLQSRKYLQTNCNVRLVLENLALNW